VEGGGADLTHLEGRSEAEDGREAAILLRDAKSASALGGK